MPHNGIMRDFLHLEGLLDVCFAGDYLGRSKPNFVVLRITVFLLLPVTLICCLLI
jgi:hypothetical protein